MTATPTLIGRIATKLRETKAWPAFFEPGSAEQLVAFVLREAREPTTEMKRHLALAVGGSHDIVHYAWERGIDAALRERG